MHPRILAAALALAVAVPLTGHGENGLKKLNDILSALAKGGPKGNLIANGGFEQPAVQKGGYISVPVGQSFDGWEVVGTGVVSPISGDYAQGGIRFVAHGGKQWLDMTGPGTNQPAGVQQTVKTQPGANYELAFWVGNVAGGGFGTSSSVEVMVDGKSLGTARNDQSIAGQQGWGLFKMPVTATGGTMTVTFINRDPANDNSNGLDDVSLVPVAGGAATTSTAAPVLAESFEMPATTNYTAYRAGQSFTTGGNTWTVQSGSIDVVNTTVRKETVAFDGVQTVDLSGSPGPGVMAATFPTTAGRTYSLAFHYARNNNLRSTPGQAKIEVMGAGPLLTTEIRHAGQPFNTNAPFNGTFVADGAMTTVRFTSLNPGNAGITVDGISVAPVEAQPAAGNVRNLSGEYTYQGAGIATISQIGDEVHMFMTWTPQGAGPHYEVKGKLAGNTVTGQWYSLYAQKGWFRFVGTVLPNGDIDLSKSDDPINANMKKSVLRKK